MGKARKRIPVIPIVFGLLFLLIVVIAVVLVVGMNHGASVSNCWHFTQLPYGKPILDEFQ